MGTTGEKKFWQKLDKKTVTLKDIVSSRISIKRPRKIKMDPPKVAKKYRTTENYFYHFEMVVKFKANGGRCIEEFWERGLFLDTIVADTWSVASKKSQNYISIFFKYIFINIKIMYSVFSTIFERNFGNDQHGVIVISSVINYLLQVILRT